MRVRVCVYLYLARAGGFIADRSAASDFCVVDNTIARRITLKTAWRDLDRR